MALDAAFLSLLKTELSKAQGAKVDKIYQPSKEEMVLSLRSKEYTGRLMLSAQADCARIHFTVLSPDNPQNPPMFCMLMRKVLGGARLRALRQPGMERVLFLDFDTVNELGDPAVITMAVEIMGRHSNIIVMDEQNKIIDAIKRVGPTMSSVRPILPGLTYQMPPSQEKINLLDTTGEQALKSMLQSPAPKLQKAFMETLAGFSPIVSREFCQYTAQDVDVQKEDLDKRAARQSRVFFKPAYPSAQNPAGHPLYGAGYRQKTAGLYLYGCAPVWVVRPGAPDGEL